jgi:hypothetical protein
MEAKIAALVRDVKVSGEIAYPIEVATIEILDDARRRMGSRVGAWVSIRPVKDEKTYLGVLVGDLPLYSFATYNTQTKALSVIPHRNPAVWVPDLGRIVWGCESWWGVIDSPEGLREISDADISNVWYVRALKDLTTAKQQEESRG